MIVVMRNDATQEHLDRIIDKIRELGYQADVERGVFKNVIGVIGDTRAGGRDALEVMPGVERVIPILKPYKHVSRDFRREDTVIEMDGGLEVGGQRIIMMVGPCAVESREQMLASARAVQAHGFPVLRGGAFKPRTSPYTFQGLGLEGLRLLREAADAHGLLVITEVMSEMDVEMCAEYADILQIGARTMHAFRLLQAVGRTKKPVLLKRGFDASIREWLLSAEYIVNEGNWNVMLCERGIRSFDDEFARNVLDLTAVQVLKRESHFPVIVDPSHGTGVRDLVIPMAKAAVAAGADGLLIEVHPDPTKALSDGPQSLPLEWLPRLQREVGQIAQAVGRTL
ncbi:MAG: 3-deoxy-7-phosphoheptulonate synthase [Chloroflexi bacterium]|nr:3-deoxy-7-phosphoheptulonate synthase [Chloroflexota bacterium]